MLGQCRSSARSGLRWGRPGKGPIWGVLVGSGSKPIPLLPHHHMSVPGGAGTGTVALQGDTVPEGTPAMVWGQAMGSGR